MWRVCGDITPQSLFFLNNYNSILVIPWLQNILRFLNKNEWTMVKLSQLKDKTDKKNYDLRLLVSFLTAQNSYLLKINTE